MSMLEIIAKHGILLAVTVITVLMVCYPKGASEAERKLQKALIVGFAAIHGIRWATLLGMQLG